jgi:predicted pyridoxine 5'-phosphate oxidase superfamily flavin-nucleotide-binding protein
MTDLNIEPRPNPFHEGEIALQKSTGMAERMRKIGPKIIRDYMPDQHREFFGQLPFMVAASVNAAGDVWPTLLTGKPGFMASPDPKHLLIDAIAYQDDPAREGMQKGGAIGMLGIELHTRRRNRMNGTIKDVQGDQLAIEVGHSFGNCPKYIQLREFEFQRDPKIDPDSKPEESAHLTADARSIIEAADTFFVASYFDKEGDRQIDASHRGGKPGFIRVDADNTLQIPDFMGNFHFNTLGNFLINPRAGLLFIDFESGDILQLAGTARVIADAPEIGAFEGAQRIWIFHPTRVILRRGASPLRWSMREDGISPNSLKTGSWKNAAGKANTEKLDQES